MRCIKEFRRLGFFFWIIYEVYLILLLHIVLIIIAVGHFVKGAVGIMGMNFACAYCDKPYVSAQLTESTGNGVALYPCPDCLNISTIQFEEGRAELKPFGNMQDMREVFPVGSIPHEVLIRVRETAESLPPLPEVCRRIMLYAHDPLSSMDDIANELKEDPALATCVLKLANSAAFGGVTPITRLDEACSRLGLKQIVRLVQTVGFGAMYRGVSNDDQEYMQMLWRHSIASAQAAYVLSLTRCPEHADLLFLAGLVHDLGALTITKILKHGSITHGTRLRTDEEAAAKFVSAWHSLAGAHAVDQRNMPADFVLTTYCHDQPEVAPCEKSQTLSKMVGIAEKISALCEAGYDEGSDLLTEEDPHAQEMRLTNEEIERITTRVKTDMESMLGAMAS